jgi:hypothetical protein
MEGTAIYIGRRIAHNGKLVHAFVTPKQLDEVIEAMADKTFLAYPNDFTDWLERKCSLFALKRTPPVIGGNYIAPEITDDRVTKMSNDPKWSPEFVEGARQYHAAWEAADRSAYMHQRNKTRERNANADPQLTKALDLLRDRYRKVMPGDRIGFQVWLINEILKR